MRPSREVESSDQVLWSLRALGGEATLGDLVAATGLPRSSVERSLDALIATQRGHVRVLERGDVTYHVGRIGFDGVAAPWLPGFYGAERRRTPPRSELVAARRAAFDRKTLRLIRTRDGVLSLAELVEQTGLPLRAAEVEMQRLARSWGGEAHVGLDGHTVYAFPLLMESVHGRFAAREPRPAWVRSEDPMDHARQRRRRARRGMVMTSAGSAMLVGVPFAVAATKALGVPGVGTAAVAVSVLGASLVIVGLRDVLRHHRRFRFQQRDTLRRYALGHVVETALAGKGVVSLKRTVRFIQARAGKRKVPRALVEAALRDLAEEFGAPITTEGDDLFFGFRSVKRQFLASYLVRRQLALGRRVAGDTVYDTEDAPAAAAARELALFDRELGTAATDAPAR
ncbi:MAG: hypothetical protein LJF06_10850 [Gemmatimonadetes bacterium]|nr:hypothetical protein [Gemmatimonadota bacterium]